jgi:tripartite-type tricarboxylate transporter receptor subunit TctC
MLIFTPSLLAFFVLLLASSQDEDHPERSEGRQVIPIAVSSETRLAEAPQVPTLKELGYPNLATSTWFGLSGPAKMPRDVVEKINRAVSEVLRRPAVRERIQRDAIETRTMSPEEYTAYMASGLQSWGPLAKQLAPQN